MTLYIITYALKGKKNYIGLYEAIQGYDVWCHYIESTWIIKTDETPDKIWDRLRPHLDSESDNLLIVEFGNSYYGWLPKEAWDWIKNNK